MRPDDPAAQADYSYALIFAGKLAEAEEVARRAAALPRADAKPLAALANVEFYQSLFAKGRENVAKARSLSTDENERFGLEEFALFTHVAEGKYRAALEAAFALETAARAAKNPNTVVGAVLDRALAQEKAGDKAAARATRASLVSQQRTQDSFYLVLRQQLLKKASDKVPVSSNM